MAKVHYSKNPLSRQQVTAEANQINIVDLKQQITVARPFVQHSTRRAGTIITIKKATCEGGFSSQAISKPARP